MDKYEVMLYPQAFCDIDNIYAYIAREKLSPENAKKQTDRIWNAIRLLEQFPDAHQDRLVGKYVGKGYIRAYKAHISCHFQHRILGTSRGLLRKGQRKIKRKGDF